jgi:hypothetical protein
MPEIIDNLEGLKVDRSAFRMLNPVSEARQV